MSRRFSSDFFSALAGDEVAPERVLNGMPYTGRPAVDALLDHLGQDGFTVRQSLNYAHASVFGLMNEAEDMFVIILTKPDDEPMATPFGFDVTEPVVIVGRDDGPAAPRVQTVRAFLAARRGREIRPCCSPPNP